MFPRPHIPPVKVPPIDVSASTSRAFTLIELLAVITIIGILSAIVLATLSTVRASAHRAKCLSNLRQIGIAAMAYSLDNKQKPVPINFYRDDSTRYLLQYLPTLYSTPNSNSRQTSIWICPADTREDKSGGGMSRQLSYGANSKALGLVANFDNPLLKSVDLVNRPSMKVYFADSRAYYMDTASGNQNARFRHDGGSDGESGTKDGGKINILFFDYHVATKKFATKASFYVLANFDPST
ncbi:prepilin-type N-terminal cleavage/methylation domain-containing protein [Opitutaceae bacterium TAV4]|nr:prepilin-type N-terminal cleavage/methylation domain-containing protein [Opitutaceae bacterium TAV4]RRJ98432.1 prepilin-type N-terminal cleavage/methylation domain-containing protein [Opitutaceae bacterium TAV3]